MNRSELKDIIRESVEEVMKEFAPLGVADEGRLDEKAPPHFPKALHDKLLKQYKGEEDKAYATMWKIFYAKDKGHKKIDEMWTAWEAKSVNEAIPDEDPNNPTYVEYLSQRQGEVPFMMGGTKWEYVNAKYPKGRKDIGVYSFAEDMVYSYDAFRSRFNINEDEGHDETDLSNPEEAKEVQIARQIHELVKKFLSIHGVGEEAEAEGEEGEEGGEEAAEAPVNEEGGEEDLDNPEENEEVEIAKQIKSLADELLKMHGVEGEELSLIHI